MYRFADQTAAQQASTGRETVLPAADLRRAALWLGLGGALFVLTYALEHSHEPGGRTLLSVVVLRRLLMPRAVGIMLLIAGVIPSPLFCSLFRWKP